MKTKVAVLSVFLNVLLILAACGGAGNPITSVGHSASKKLHAFVGAMPGFHGVTGTTTRTTSFDISLTPKLYAQTQTTVSFTGSYSGFCNSLTTPTGSFSIMYGGGVLDTSACNASWFDTGDGAAASALASQLVIGDGTLGPLVAYADSSHATVRVYVIRGGQAIDTGIAATVDGKRGTSTATFPVIDGDMVAVIAQSDGNSHNLQFVLAKE
jgi:hypothetical protein